MYLNIKKSGCEEKHTAAKCDQLPAALRCWQSSTPIRNLFDQTARQNRAEGQGSRWNVNGEETVPVHCGCFFHWVVGSLGHFIITQFLCPSSSPPTSPPLPFPFPFPSKLLIHFSVHLCILSLSSSVSLSFLLFCLSPFLCLISVDRSQWSPLLWCRVAALCPVSSEALCCQGRAESTACPARVFLHLMQIQSSQRLWLILSRDGDSALHQTTKETVWPWQWLGLTTPSNIIWYHVQYSTVQTNAVH